MISAPKIAFKAARVTSGRCAVITFECLKTKVDGSVRLTASIPTSIGLVNGPGCQHEMMTWEMRGPV